MKKKNRWLPALIGISVILAAWFFVCSAGFFNSYVLPSPQRVWATFLKMLNSGEIFRDVVISFGRVLRGFGIAFLLSFVIAAIRIFFPGSEPYYEYLIQFFRNVPPLSLIPLLILWCGIGETTKTVIIVLASFFPMYLSIVKGFTGCDQKLLEVLCSFLKNAQAA